MIETGEILPPNYLFERCASEDDSEIVPRLRHAEVNDAVDIESHQVLVLASALAKADHLSPLKRAEVGGDKPDPAVQRLVY